MGMEVIVMEISARNKIKGIVKEVKKGEVAALIKVEGSTPADITAMITKEAVEELDIKVGEEVTAMIKATEVMISKE